MLRGRQVTGLSLPPRSSIISNKDLKLGQSFTQTRQSLQMWNVRSRSARATVGS
jgi:hypothetical protein